MKTILSRPSYRVCLILFSLVLRQRMMKTMKRSLRALCLDFVALDKSSMIATIVLLIIETLFPVDVRCPARTRTKGRAWMIWLVESLSLTCNVRMLFAPLLIETTTNQCFLLVLVRVVIFLAGGLTWQLPPSQARMWKRPDPISTIAGS